MVTFNEMLRVHGIDPAQVTLLRHTGKKGPLGFSPYDLWRREDGSFDLYQCTQAPGQRRFEMPFWAAFVSTPSNETLFVGLYAVTKGDRSEIDWLCPISELPPGQDKGRPSDLYRLTPLDALSGRRGNLKIEWDAGWISWARYALRSDHVVLGEVHIEGIDLFEASQEGVKTWREQRMIERDSRLAKAALAKNFGEHEGQYACEACRFEHADSALFDVHHPHPLLAGPRMTRVSDLIVLCPLCHRRAHRSGNKLSPYSLVELRAWNEGGRK